MLTQYCDFSLGTNGHAGTTGDPYSAPDMVAAAPGAIDDVTYNIINGGSVPPSQTIYNNNGHAIIMQPWNPTGFWWLSSSGFLAFQAYQNNLTVIGGYINPATIYLFPVNGHGMTFNSCVVNSHMAPGGLDSDTGNILTFNGCWFKLAGSGGDYVPQHYHANMHFIDSIYQVPFQWTAPDGQGQAIDVFFTNCVTDSANGAAIVTGPATSFTDVGGNSQFGWTPTALPAYNDFNQSDWAASALAAGITTPPEPGSGSPSYTGYSTGFWGAARTGIGAMYFGSPAAPIFHISPTFYSFTSKPSGMTSDQTVTVSNTGTAPLIVSTMTGLSGAFSVMNDHVSGSTMNNNGDSSTFVLQYQPTALGASSGSLSISSNDAGSPYLFHVDGTAVAANSFSSPTVADGTVVVSTINSSTLVAAIQAFDGDPYFDATSQLSRAVVYYSHQDGRQSKRVIHDLSGTSLIGAVTWAPGAKDGTWQKSSIKVYDANGALRELPRSAIGTGEDITHSDGTMNLNT